MKQLLKILIGIVSIPLMAFVLLWLWAWCYFNPGSFQRERMNAVVEEMRHQPINVGQMVMFKMDDYGHPKVFHVVKDSDQWPWHIWAQRTEENALKVTIMTRDRGHFGVYGFAYPKAGNRNRRFRR